MPANTTSTAEKTLLSALKEINLFSTLSTTEIERMSKSVSVQTFETGTTILEEGQTASGLYYILSGQVDVLKKIPDSKEQLRISTIGKSELFGELSFFDAKATSACIKSIEKCNILFIPKECILSSEQASHIIQMIATSTVARLRETDELVVNSLKKQLDAEQLRAQFGQFFLLTIFALSITILATEILNIIPMLRQSPVLKNIITWSSMLPLTIVISQIVRGRHLSWEWLGLKTQKPIRTIAEALLVSAILLLSFLLSQQFLGADTSHLSLMEYIDLDASFGSPLIWFIFYPLSCILQELVTKQFCQNSLEQFIPGPRRTYWAVLANALIFGIYHIRFSILASIYAILLGIVLGMLYVRQRNIVGVTIAHIIIGVAALSRGIIW